MSDPVLQALIEAQLTSKPSPWLVFAPALEARFEADTRRRRSQWFSLIAIVGVIIPLVMQPAVAAANPGLTSWSKLALLNAPVVVSAICAILLRFDPAPAWREGLQAFSTVLAVVVMTLVFTIGRTIDPTLYETGVLMLLMIGVLCMPLRFPYAVAMTVCVLPFYHAGLNHSGIAKAAGSGLFNAGVAAAILMLIANWRAERDMRLSYVLTLGERLRRQDLSTRNRELDAMARLDKLTGIANRRAYDSWLEAAWHHAGNRGDCLGLIMLDVDRFKDYNDFYGHAAGDSCLQAIARCLGDQLRGTSDFLARFGGEEFAVLLPAQDAEVCADIAERLRCAVAALELPHIGLGAAGLVTISAGVASQISLPGTPPVTLFAMADTALFQAKQRGRNQVCVGMAGHLALEEKARPEALPLDSAGAGGPQTP